MFKKVATISTLLILAACASSQPRIIQPSANATEVRLTSGLATQIELPDSDRVQSVMIGNPALSSAESNENVINLLAKDGTGETNIIIRATDEDGHAKVYQYRLLVQPH